MRVALDTIALAKTAHKVTKLKPASVRLSRYDSPAWIREGSTVAYIDDPRPGVWRDVVWLLMTAAGMLLFAFAALSV